MAGLTVRYFKREKDVETGIECLPPIRALSISVQSPDRGKALYTSLHILPPIRALSISVLRFFGEKDTRLSSCSLRLDTGKEAEGAGALDSSFLKLKL